MSYTFTAPPKDPQAVLPYSMDWSQWLSPGETLSTWAAVSSGDALVISGVSEAAGVVSWTATGGTAGTDYTVAVTITTNLARTDTRRVLVKVRTR